MSNNSRPFIVSIDCDDTIWHTNEDFSIGNIRTGAKEVIMKWYLQGFYIIINTCRAKNSPSGLDAEEFLFRNKIPYHTFNDQSVFSRKDWGKEIGHKIYADVYIDDKNMESVLNGMQPWVYIDDSVQAINKRRKL